MRSLSVLTVVLAVGVSYSAFAQNSSTPYSPATTAPQQWPANAAPASVASDSQGSGAIPALPLDVQTENGISYINGGISDEEHAELKAKEHEFNMHLLLSAPKGEFIGDVSLRILDSKEAPVVSIDDAGPYVYAQLPTGHYTLEATDLQTKVVKRVKISVPAKGAVKQQITFGEAGGITTPHHPTATID